MARFLLISSSPLVRVIEPLTEKSIVSPDAALAMAWRSEPGPLSAVVVTVAASPVRANRTAHRNEAKAFLMFVSLNREQQSSHLAVNKKAFFIFLSSFSE